jgi:putative ABC transport system permease protein
MILHVLRLVWNRKRANLLIAVEILLSFLVLVGVFTLAVFYADNHRRPLGFEYANIWTISAEMHSAETRASITVESAPGEAAPAQPAQPAVQSLEAAQRASVGRLLAILREMPEVEAAAAAFVTPYSDSSWISDIQVGGRRHRYGFNSATDDFARAMGLQVTRGRWFGREDDGAVWQPVVLNERLAREMFPDKDPVGQFIQDERPNETDRERRRIVGVISDFRKGGEYAAAENFLFGRNRLDDPDPEAEPPRELIVRVRPGTTADFEARAVALLRAAEPDWTFQAEALARSRETAHRFWLAPLSAAALVSLFLLLMVAMGLTGVLWLHVTQRTREIGLRRAKGATMVNIQSQLVGEVAVLTSLAVAAGIAIVVQFPVLDVFGAISPSVYAVSIIISLGCIYLLTILCAWAPGRLASRVQPADALRYE